MPLTDTVLIMAVEVECQSSSCQQDQELNCQSTNCNTLGIGCADTYWAGLNSGGEGPRSDVNAYTGVYNYPVPLPGRKKSITP